MATRFRRLFIRIGKQLPFMLCFVVLVAYAENAIALLSGDFLYFSGYTSLDTPITLFMGNIFEYDYLTIGIAFIISMAIEACKWNLCAIMYLGVNLIEKSYFDFEMTIGVIYAIAMINIVISGFFVYKGLTILKNQKTKNYERN